MADNDQNTTIFNDRNSQNDEKDDTCPLNVNETTGLVQLDDVEKKGCEESVTDTPGDAFFNSNVIILGSIAPEGSQKCDAHQQPKRRKPNELEALGVTEVKEEFDVFTDETNKIYRKYRLRNVVKKPDYRIPSIGDLPKLQSFKAILPGIHECPEPECAKVFNTTIKLQTHMRREHNIKYKCSLCSEIFETNTELVSHKSVHDAENNSYVCHGCKLAFSDYCDFLVHEFTHSKYRNKFQCPECGLVTCFRSSIQKHVRTHFNRTITCPICFEEVPGVHRLPEHIRQHDSKLDCVECGKRLTSKKQYEEHMTVHTGVKVHQCLYCGKGFRTKNQKEVHTRIHTNERLFKCKICDKKFLQSTDMLRHQARHDKIRKIQCDICQKKFVQNMDLRYHMKTHAKGYSCPECGKKFSIMTSLKNHLIQVHSTERPVECKLCDLRFASQKNYRRHTKSKKHKRSLFKEIKNK